VLPDFGTVQPMNEALCYENPCSGWDSLQLGMHMRAFHLHHPVTNKHNFIKTVHHQRKRSTTLQLILRLLNVSTNFCSYFWKLYNNLVRVKM